MAYQTYHCSTAFRYSVCLISFLHTSLALSILHLLWSVRHTHSLHRSSSVQFSCCTLLLLHTWITFTNYNHNKLQQQQQQHLFSVPCIYRFCAPCACNVHNASTCWLHTVILHLSSALSYHDCDSSASMVVRPVSLASLYVILRFLILSGSLRLFVFSVIVELTFSVSVTGLNSHQLSIASTDIFIPLRDSSLPLPIIP